MSLIFHHLAHDLRRHALPLAAWCLILATHVFLSGSGFLETHAAPAADPSGLLALVVAVVTFLPLLLAILVVQGDAPADEGAFWMTRPLGGSALLSSKLLLVALFFLVLPFAAEAAILMLRGAGVRVGLAVPEFLVTRAAPVLAAFAAGALTRDLFRGIGFLAGLVLAVTGTMIGLLLVVDIEAVPRGHHLLASRLLVGVLLIGTGSLVAAAVAYRGRRPGAARLITFAPAVLAGWAFALWPLDLVGSGAAGAAAAPMGDFRVAYAPGSPVSLTTHSDRGSGQEAGRISLPVEMSGMPDVGVAAVLSAEATFLFEAGPDSPITLTQGGMFASAIGRGHGATRRLFPGFTFGNAGVIDMQEGLSDDGFVETLKFPGRLAGATLDIVRESATSRVSLQGKAGWFALEIAGELPLDQGARWSCQGDEVEIAAAQAEGSELRLVLETREIRQLFDPARLGFPRWFFVLTHPEKKLAVSCQPSSVRNLPVLRGFSPLAGTRLVCTAEVPSPTAGTPGEKAAGWIDGGRLVIVRPVFQGAVGWQVAPAIHPVVDLHRSLP